MVEIYFCLTTYEDMSCLSSFLITLKSFFINWGLLFWCFFTSTFFAASFTVLIISFDIPLTWILLLLSLIVLKSPKIASYLNFPTNKLLLSTDYLIIYFSFYLFLSIILLFSAMHKFPSLLGLLPDDWCYVRVICSMIMVYIRLSCNTWFLLLSSWSSRGVNVYWRTLLHLLYVLFPIRFPKIAKFNSPS